MQVGAAYAVLGLVLLLCIFAWLQTALDPRRDHDFISPMKHDRWHQ